MLERFPSLQAVLAAEAAHRMYREIYSAAPSLRQLLQNVDKERCEQELLRWETDGGATQ